MSWQYDIMIVKSLNFQQVQHGFVKTVILLMEIMIKFGICTNFKTWHR